MEDTLIDALDALERDQFWAVAEAARARRRTMTPEQLATVAAAEADAQRRTVAAAIYIHLSTVIVHGR